MSLSAQPYLGIMTPFGGLRVLARSGQGLLGQSEELDELLSKVLKDEMKEGIVAKIQDDILIGGIDQRDTAHNYTSPTSRWNPLKYTVSRNLATLRDGFGEKEGTWNHLHTEGVCCLTLRKKT